MRERVELSLQVARLMAQAAIDRAHEVGALETVCIVDANGFPLVLQRMDDARFTGPQIAWNKAFTAAGHRRSTHLFNTPPDGPALPGNEGFGIQLSFEGRFAAFVGGFPIVIDGRVVGAIGLSGGYGEQDTQAALAALQALADYLEPQGMHVLVKADIRVKPAIKR